MNQKPIVLIPFWVLTLLRISGIIIGFCTGFILPLLLKKPGSLTVCLVDAVVFASVFAALLFRRRT